MQLFKIMMELFIEDAGQERGGSEDGANLPFKMPKGFPFGKK